MYSPYLDCISANISHKSRMINSYRARHSYQKSLQGCKLKTPPEETRKRFAALVTINELDYKFKLTATFQKALDDTEAAVTLQYAQPPVPINQPPAPQ